MEFLAAIRQYLDNIEGFRDEEKAEIDELFKTAEADLKSERVATAESHATDVKQLLATQKSDLETQISGLRSDIEEKLSVEPNEPELPEGFEEAVQAVAALVSDVTEVKANLSAQDTWRVDFEAKVAKTPFGREISSREGEADEAVLLTDEESADLEKNCCTKATHYWKQICDGFEKEYGSYVPVGAPEAVGTDPAYVEALQAMILPGESARFVEYNGRPARG